MLLKDQIEIRDEDTQINIRTLVNTELHTDHLVLATIQSQDRPFPWTLEALQGNRRKPDNRAVRIGGAAFHKHAFYATVIHFALDVARESDRGRRWTSLDQHSHSRLHRFPHRSSEAGSELESWWASHTNTWGYSSNLPEAWQRSSYNRWCSILQACNSLLLLSN